MNRRSCVVAVALSSAALSAAALSACSGSGGTRAEVTQTPSTVPATNQQPPGFIGDIDAARKAAVCANAREAQTVLSIGGAAVTDPLVADAGLLERPPVDPKAAADAVTIRRDLRQGHVQAALAMALTYCGH